MLDPVLDDVVLIGTNLAVLISDNRIFLKPIPELITALFATEGNVFFFCV